MMPNQPDPTAGEDRRSRRSFLAAGLAGVGGLAVGAVAGAASAPDSPSPPAEAVGQATVPFFGAHQAGIDTPPQAHAAFLGFDLDGGTDREGLSRLLRLWTDDAARLTAGRGALADTEPELAAAPARLTVTTGLGPGALDRIGMPPSQRRGVRPLPSFRIDRLEPVWTGGDLLLQVCADDPLVVSHAARMLTKDVRTFGALRWRQDGFQRRPDGLGVGRRNLLGQVDGTANPEPGTADFQRTVWIETGPAAGGTTLVLRRIRMDLDRWDRLDRPDRELVVGRRLADGAPLTGHSVDDDLDLEATDPAGLPLIPAFSHVRRAHPSVTGTRILRRGFNYEAAGARGRPEAGLLFAAFQADVAVQYLPIQRSLAELDLLNDWTTPVGSAVFLVPPGCRPGGFVGDALF
jgi:dye decolorizing peroxidase